MLIILLMIQKIIACPQVHCLEIQDSLTCMQYNSATKSYNMQACNNTNYTCPHPSHMSINYPLECEFWVDSRFWTSASWSDYYQYAVLSSGDNCDPYGVVSVCDTSAGLVCYCPYSDCYCVKGLEYGVDCVSNPIPCRPGFVCSNKICTQMYSVEAGAAATNELACAGGGPLIVSNGTFTCRVGPKTLGGIPKPCTTDNDCVSDTGSETTKCACGLNSDGQAYCHLHYSDAPMKSWRDAERSGDYKLEIYWKFISVNYPYLQGSLESCLGDVWRDFYQYKLGEPAGKSGGVMLEVLILMLVI